MMQMVRVMRVRRKGRRHARDHMIVMGVAIEVGVLVKGDGGPSKRMVEGTLG